MKEPVHPEIERAIHWIRTERPRRVVVLTGAGISAESGIPTFRGAGGLWKNFRPEELATPGAFARDPQTVWEWYEWRRGLVREAKPNAAHEALARLEASLPVTTVITQNVDGLHRRAGSRNLLELHGNLFRVRCVREERTIAADEPFESLPPRCSCGSLLRPDIVWFGEPLDEQIFSAAVEAVESADLLLIVGTSGVVYPAAGLASMMRGGGSIEVNPEATPLSGASKFTIPTTATAGVPPLVDAILEVSQ